MRRLFAGTNVVFAISEDGELFSWGGGNYGKEHGWFAWTRCGTIGLTGHGDMQPIPSPKRVEALRGVRVSSFSIGWHHALALAEDRLGYAWGENVERATLGNPNVEVELLPKPVEALRGVRVGSISAAFHRNYAVADTGELWAWGVASGNQAPIGHGEQMNCLLPKPIESLRGVKVDAVAASQLHILALADDGSVFAWGCGSAALSGALGLGPSVSDAGVCASRPCVWRVGCDV
jgi:E3 ubiquitin-protein ligase HERC2